MLKGIEDATQVQTAHLEEFMNKLANEGYTPKSISRKTKKLR